MSRYNLIESMRQSGASTHYAAFQS